MMAIDTRDIHIGREGYLFLFGGNHGVFSLFAGDRDPKPSSPQVLRKNLEERAAYCATTGHIFQTVVFPDKCYALSELVDSHSTLQSLFQRFYLPHLGDCTYKHKIIYPVECIKDRRSAFLLTDTHYSAVGNLAVVEQILKGIIDDELIRKGRKIVSSCIGSRPDFSGDLGKNFTPQHHETASFLLRNPLAIKIAANGIQAGNEGICILVESPDALTSRTAVIFGDSFFRATLPMLAVFYRRIIFMRTRYFHYEMAEAFSPNDIFCGVAERYLSQVHPDTERPHFLSYPLIAGRLVSPDHGFGELWQRFVDQSILAAAGALPPNPALRGR
jgi:hypothetical protein